MNSERKIGVAIVGCGNIARLYSQQVKSYTECRLLGFHDIVPERAEAFAGEYDGKAYGSLEDLLADEQVELVINLTIHHVHYEVIKQCLEAGKHVYTEKPLAMDAKQAVELVNLAETRELRLTSAPITYMGEAQQAFWKLVRDGRLGEVRLAYAEVNHGRIETWHPNPEPFYQVGPLWDVGVYPLTLLTAILGPVRRVFGHSRLLCPERTTLEGRDFILQTPDFYLATLDFESGAVGRLTTNFYAKGSPQAGTLELHGDEGFAVLGDFQNFAAPVRCAKFGSTPELVELKRPPFRGIEFGRGVEDLARAILEQRPHRADATHACHVVEVVCGILESAKTGRAVSIDTTFRRPKPMDWADRMLISRESARES
jgi:predicted dehydrogenase